VCQTAHCQQTYPINQFNAQSINISCEKCGGTLIGKDGHVRLSQHATIIPVITPQEIEENRQKELTKKREELALLQKDIHRLEQEVY